MRQSRLKQLAKGLLGMWVVALVTQCAQSDTFYSNTLRADLFSQIYAEDKYDFLWVFDNSPSMKDKVAYVRDNFNRFLGILTTRKAIDFQMAVVTGDFMIQQGQLISSDTGLKVVTNASADPIADFASIVKNVKDTTRSFWDQDLESAYQAISKYGSTFMRKGVPLIIIVVTDGDDSSCQSHCYGREPRHNPDQVPYPIERYIDYFKNIKASESTNTFFFPIIGLHSSSCEVQDYGMRYYQVASALGGTVGSVCLAEIGSAYDNIAKTIGDRGTRFPLTSQASGHGIIVSVDGEIVPYSKEDGYFYEASTNSIVFTGTRIPKKGAKVQIAYKQQTA